MVSSLFIIKIFSRKYNLLGGKEFFMEQVSSYLIKMLPCLFIVLPVYLLFRRFYLLKRNGIHSSTISREFSLLFFTIYLTGLASLTIVPDFKITNQSITPIEIGYNQERINLVPLNKINETQIIVENGNPSYLFFEVCGNIGAFIPIGFLLPFYGVILLKLFEPFSFVFSFHLRLKQSN